MYVLDEQGIIYHVPKESGALSVLMFIVTLYLNNFLIFFSFARYLATHFNSFKIVFIKGNLAGNLRAWLGCAKMSLPKL